MKRTLTIAFVLLACALLATPCGAGKVKHPSELKYSKITLESPTYEEIGFENGMTGFVIEDHEVPVVNIYMLVDTPRPPKEKTGLDQLATWAIRNGGSENWPADKLNEELEFVAASVEVMSGTGGGGRRRGGGGGRGASIRVSCLKKDLGLCLSILGDLLVYPSFPDEKIELRRETMLENIRRENDEPRRVAAREFRNVNYGDHPMAWRPTEETVGAITRDDIVRYHSQYFHPNNTIVGVSGDITKDEIVAALDKSLAQWQPATVEIEPEPAIELTFKPSVTYLPKPEMNQAVIMIGHLGLNSKDEERMAVTLMNFILGGGSFTSRITQKVRTDEGLAYAAYSMYGSDPWTFGLFQASSQTRSDAAARAIGLILGLIEEMRDEGPTEEEFESARDRYLNTHVFDYDSKSAVVERLVRLKWQGRPLDSAERDFEKIGSLTIAEVRKAAATYLHPEDLAIVVVGDESTFDQPLSKFGEVNVIELWE